jgi:cytochrome b561
MSAPRRYGLVAMLLHWASALLILGLFASGLWMVEAIRDPARQMAAFETYQLHKSVGVTVFALSVLRLAWRLANPPPPLPEGMGTAARLAARGVHAGFYLVLLGAPLAGWVMVSASPLGLPTLWFGVAEVPHLPLAPDAPLEAAAKRAHQWLVWGGMALLALHVLAALKHQFLDGDRLMLRMIPGRAR